MSGDEPRPYRFGPRDARGLVLGVRPGQAAAVSVAAIVAVGLLRATGSPIRFVAIGLDLFVAVVAAFLPVRGRPLGAWVPVAASYVAACATGRRREVAVAPHVRRSTVPSLFAGFSIETISSRRGQSIGAVLDRRHGTLTGAVVVSGSPFALLDDVDREQEVSGWASVLTSLATGPLAPLRVQWIERTVPDRRQALRDRVTDLLEPPRASRPDQGAIDRARASYAAFVETESHGSLRHESVVAVTVRARGLVGHRIRGTERGARLDGQAHLCAALTALEDRLASVGVAVVGGLTPSGMSGFLGRTFRDAETPLAQAAWPVAAEAKWGSFRTDALVHSTYWIAEWPRSDVSSEFLLPLIYDSGGRRAITVVMEPLGSARAVRRAEHARTSARADSEIRRRHGFSQTAKTTRQHDAVIRREEELASGHAGYRFSGYVTVSAHDTAELEQSCARIEQAAALARLELRRLFGNQDSAFCCSLPLGRGCG